MDGEKKVKLANRRSGTGRRSHTIHVPGCTYGTPRLAGRTAGAGRPLLDI